MYFKWIIFYLVIDAAGSQSLTKFLQRAKRSSNCRTKEAVIGRCVRIQDCNNQKLPDDYVFTMCRTNLRGVCCPIAMSSESAPVVTSLSNGGISDCSTRDNQPGQCKRILECPSPPEATTMCISRTRTRGICCPVKTEGERFCGKDKNQLPIMEFVIGGRIAQRETWPWMVALYYKANQTVVYKCGGVVIGKRHVLTAAHCLEGNLNPSMYILRIGGFDLSKPTKDDQDAEDADIEEIIPYPLYAKKKFNYDIAILKLKTEIGRIDRRICIPDKNVENSAISPTHAFLAGWGLTQLGGSTTIGTGHSTLLRQARLPIISTAECEIQYKIVLKDHKDGFEGAFPDGIDASMFICAGDSNNRRDACEGDSGGPLMMESRTKEWSVVGVVSVGSKYCGNGNLPTLYTRVHFYESWIEKVLSE